jgi:hypothetical protein
MVLYTFRGRAMCSGTGGEYSLSAASRQAWDWESEAALTVRTEQTNLLSGCQVSRWMPMT